MNPYLIRDESNSMQDHSIHWIFFQKIYSLFQSNTCENVSFVSARMNKTVVFSYRKKKNERDNIDGSITKINND